jgi:hypothetical protein
MAIPVLKLNLAPPPTLWRQHHETLGLLALALGALALVLASGISVRKYVQANREGKRMVSISEDAQRVSRDQSRLMENLRRIDAAERGPRYKLAERIFQERTLPWSRLTAELERSLVQDVRVKSLQRVRNSDGAVSLKVRGESRSRDSEVKFVEALQANGMFAQVVLEREGERSGGGIDYDLSLPVASAPPAYEPLPIPPPVKVDQFGKPLAKDSKIIRKLSGGRPLAAAPVPAPPVRPQSPALEPRAPQPAPALRVEPGLDRPSRRVPQPEQRAPGRVEGQRQRPAIDPAETPAARRERIRAEKYSRRDGGGE